MRTPRIVQGDAEGLGEELKTRGEVGGRVESRVVQKDGTQRLCYGWEALLGIHTGGRIEGDEQLPPEQLREWFGLDGLGLRAGYYTGWQIR